MSRWSCPHRPPGFGPPPRSTLGDGWVATSRRPRKSALPARAGVAQLVEQLIRNQQVSGSSPLAGSNSINNLRRSRIQTDPTRVTTVSPTTRRPVDIDTPPARRAGEGSTRPPRGSIPRTGQSLTERRPGPMGRPDRPDGTAIRHGGTASLADGTLDRRRWDRLTTGRGTWSVGARMSGSWCTRLRGDLSDHDALDIVDADPVGDPVVELRLLCRAPHSAEQLSVGGAAVIGQRWQCVHRAGDRKLDWTKPPPAVGLLWALHCWQTALAATGRGDAGRSWTARGRRRWPRRWSYSPPRGSQTQVDRPGDSGSSGRAPGGRRCASHDESRMAGHAQAPGWSTGCMSPAWQRGHWRNERPVSAS